MTHEVSSIVANDRLNKAIASGKSFIYDSTRNKNYADKAKEAMANGLNVTIHHVTTPRAVALMRNDDRDRQVPRGRLLGTHDKADEVRPILIKYAKDSTKGGGPAVQFRSSKGYSDSDVKRAKRLGYTDTDGPDVSGMSVSDLKSRQ